MKLSDLWKELSDLGGVLDNVERSVRKLSIRPTPKGRVTPFFATKRFVFQKGDFEMQSSPLISSAGRVTRVTRLTYSVQVELPTSTATGNTFLAPDTFIPLEMRPTARGMTRRTPATMSANYGSNFGGNDVELAESSSVFDFEWAFSIGSTERRYAQRRDVSNGGGGVFMSRNSLGNPENDKQLLFSEKHPIVLPTNEFLTFMVRPTFSYLNSPGPSSFTTLPEDPVVEAGGRFVVNISYAGYRTFGYEESE